MHYSQPLRRLLAVGLACSLGGCGLFQGLYGDGVLFGAARRIEFRISDKLNDDYPVAVELIVVYTKDLEKEIAALTASEWFAQRAQYLRDFSLEEMEAFRWEWVPGQSAAPQEFSYRRGARAAVVFASYATPGDHRVRVEAPNHALRVTLDAAGFQVEAL